MGLEGIVSKRLGSRYRSGRSPDWLKFKNPEAPAVRREAEEDLRTSSFFRLRCFRFPQQLHPGNFRVLLRDPFVEVLTLKFSELRSK